MHDEADDAAPTGPAASESDVEWIVSEGRDQRGLPELVAALCRHLFETGVPLARVMLSQRTLHPLVAARGIFWRQGNAGCTEQVDRGHDVLRDKIYLKSPLRVAYEHGKSVRRRLVGPEARLDFPVLEELRDEGITDYLALPMPFTGRIGGVMTWATARPEGFGVGDIARLKALIPVLALMVEVHATRDLARTVLETYVGTAAGQRVLSGQIKRGDQEQIRAVLWYCDLRGFTSLTEKLDGPRLIDMLNQYFERMTAPVRAHGGEVMKFIGDAMLAIFSLDNRDAEIASNAALQAAREAIQSMNAHNITCVECGEPSVDFGIALHMGEVIFGNIGAPDRLDFTVIGPAVNRVVRIEEMCRKLDCGLLVSAEVARHCREPLASIGRHDLRGVGEKVELFTLPDLLRRTAAAAE
ncbi:MAG: adenylate/guanylate cyclase domain-containing protein [Alphaproteobacteria bacterium]|nr:adenylate/guanylate cyclase domain-containing protein [Alphaproteobacteria bacterium]